MAIAGMARSFFELMARLPLLLDSCKIKRQSGFTLFEVLIAMLLLSMVATMIYSILNVSIRFTDKGGKNLVAMSREHAFLDLLRRQMSAAWLDEKQRRPIVRSEDGVTTIVTRNPLLLPNGGTVLAVYRVNEEERAVYYTEKRDFYNIDYDEEYEPQFEEMMALFPLEAELTMEVDEETSVLTVVYGDKEFELVPKTAEPVDGDTVQTTTTPPGLPQGLGGDQ
jgi:prepilin-type N-terminal cleavage/methylation domain-containing protein